MERIRSWEKECSAHKKCALSPTRKVPGRWPELPTRILELRSDDPNRLRLVDGKGKTGPYVALSYCWGISQALTTTKLTLAQRRREIVLGDMPQTLQDALFIAQQLGIPYIWIDALCIIQDDKSDWQKEAALMGTVYRNSHLTIAASNAPTSSAGFLHPRKPSHKLQLQLHSQDQVVSTLYLQPRRGLSRAQDSLKDEPLMSRAWTLQERYLPWRSLHFGKDQMYWECEDGLFSESGDWTVRNVGMNDLLDRSMDRLGEPKDAISQNVSYFGWYFMMEIYSQRNITYGRDRLPALSGIARYMATRSQDKYCAGLWWKDIRVGLLWTAKHFLRQPSEWRVPSWSCLALDGLIEFRGLYRVGDSLAIWKGCDMVLAGDDMFGEVLSGSIILEAPLCPVIFMEEEKYSSQKRENAVTLTLDFGNGFGPGNGFLDVQDYLVNSTFVILLAQFESDARNGVSQPLMVSYFGG
jgi:hypothetical protein